MERIPYMTKDRSREYTNGYKVKGDDGYATGI